MLSSDRRRNKYLNNLNSFSTETWHACIGQLALSHVALQLKTDLYRSLQYRIYKRGIMLPLDGVA